MIPFSPPRMDKKTTDAVAEVLLSGWITSGPKTKEFEKQLADYSGNEVTLCLNSATAGLELVLRWFGVGPGDEVIVPAYTYCATANVVEHCGAKVIFVDVNAHDFNISLQNVEAAITPNTKVIMPVDFSGYPCDYDDLNDLVKRQDIREKFQAHTEEQKKLGRILILSDAAHSFGALYYGTRAGSLTDVSVFSFHAVKNLTTAEGGAIALNLPAPFNNQEIYDLLRIYSLHGQNKDALAKSKVGAWEYDVISPGFKCNMTDIQAAIGLVELSRYDDENLPARKHIIDRYSAKLSSYAWAEIPLYESEYKITSYHLFPLRIKGIVEAQRNSIIEEISKLNVAVNVHFKPVPMMTYYKNKGYNIADYPVAYDNYQREISLPVYYGLTDAQVETVLNAVIASVEKVLKA
jgi:dTDP-4-amino-4,6-dideoxygalactose transaminase